MRPLQILSAAIGLQILTTSVLTAIAQPSNVATTPPVYVPDYSHANDPLPDGVIAWDATQKSVDATNGTDFARFDFSFTNISPGTVTILSGRGSCGCTTVQLPATPWQVPAGGAGEFTATINLAGYTGSIFKYAIISTDKGTKNLMLRVDILPAPPAPPLSEEERARGMAAAKVDRQAVFKGDCASCHAKNLEGKYGHELFAQACAICHEATPRATMVPDLHHLKDPTSQEFWQTWIMSGKAGTLMPAFARSQGGPLSDQQIASLAAYLNAVIPPQAAPAGAK